MSKRTYHGSCHCGAVTFEVDLDLGQGTTKCNCTSCWKRRWWGAAVKPEDVRSISGEAELSRFRDSQVERGGFCRRCGVAPYAWVDADEWNDGDYISVNLACLDDLAPADLAAAPVTYLDGRADTWETPDEIRHL
jgi:hypothetical protein